MTRFHYVACCAGACVLALFSANNNEAAVVTVGSQQTVSVGGSDIFDTLDYSDTWTLTGVYGGSNPDRTNGLHPTTDAARIVENPYTNTPRTWIGFDAGFPGDGMAFSLNQDGSVAGASSISSIALGPYPGASGNGSGTGVTQTGTQGDWYIQYGLRNHFIVQTDGVRSGNSSTYSVRISSLATVGGSGPSTLAVIFSGDGKIHLHDGSANAAVDTGYFHGATTNWQNYAVEFERAGSVNQLTFYVNESVIGALDLTSFNGGSFANYSTQRIGVGGRGNRFWSDNFQVGGFGAVPEPASGGLFVMALAGLGWFARKRR